MLLNHALSRLRVLGEDNVKADSSSNDASGDVDLGEAPLDEGRHYVPPDPEGGETLIKTSARRLYYHTCCLIALTVQLTKEKVQSGFSRKTVLSVSKSKDDECEDEANLIQKDHTTLPPTSQESSHDVFFANTVQAMSAGLHWVGWRALMVLGIWFVGISASLQILAHLIGFWQNALWVEWAYCCWLSGAAFGLLVIADLYTDLERTIRGTAEFAVKSCIQRIRLAYPSYLAVAIRLFVPPIVTKAFWVLLILFSMIPGIGETVFALLWPLRILAAIATMFFLIRAWLLALTIPLVASQERLDLVQAIARTQQLFVRNLFQLMEAVFWGGAAVAIVLLAINSAVQQDVVVAQVTRGESAVNLYTAAPLIFRSLTEVPGIETPFFLTETKTGWWQTILSVWLATLHAILFLLIYVFLLILIIQPMDNLIRWLRFQEKRTVIQN